MVLKSTKNKKTKKIVSLEYLKNNLPKNQAVILSGTFDLDNDYYQRLLTWASKQGRPLIIVVSSDRSVAIRRGFSQPTASAKRRARGVAYFNGVDFILISSKPAHHTTILNAVRPRKLLFQQDNPLFLKALFKEIRKHNKKMAISTSPLHKKIIPTSLPALPKFNHYDPLARRLVACAEKSPAPIGKIAAVAVKGGMVVKEAVNDAQGIHAEQILLESLKKQDLTNTSIYITIPPCPMCAEVLVKAGVKEVFYLCQYGDGLGTKLLKKAGMSVQRMKFKG